MRKFLSVTAVFLWMAVIFNMSSQVAEKSSKLSIGVTEGIVETVAKVNPNLIFT